MPRPIRLNAEVRSNGRVSQQDLGQVRTALSRLGLFDPARDPSGSESVMSDGLRRALKTFQAGQGLREDAALRPRGPTEESLNRLLTQNRSLRPDDGLAARERTPGALAGRVGPGLENHPDDVAAVGAVLRQLGHIPPRAERPLFTGSVFDGLKSFQRTNGLKHDGVILPDGPTEQVLTRRLDLQPSDLRVGGRIETGPVPLINVAGAGGGVSGSLGGAGQRPVSFQTADGSGSLAGQAGDSLLAGQIAGDRLDGASDGATGGRFVFNPVPDPDETDNVGAGPAARDPLPAPPEAAGTADSQPEFKPVPPGDAASFGIFDKVMSGPTASPPNANPFPDDRFEMLLRTPEQLAAAVNVAPDLVERAGEPGSQALRGVASSMAHDEADAQRLDALLTELEQTGHKDLADRLREQRDFMLVDSNGFSSLLPSEGIRRQLKFRENVSILLDEVPGSSLLQFLDLGAKGELERRERFRKESLDSLKRGR